MPFDSTGPAGASAGIAIPYVPRWLPPPRTIDLTDDDERTLAELEAGWAHLRGPIDPKDDDLSDRWGDDDDASAAAAEAPRRGLKLNELTEAAIAEWPDMDRPTLVALMAHAGYLTRIPDERRYVLSSSAVAAGIGRNVRPKRGHMFPIIYPEHAGTVLQSLGWPAIKERIASLPNERARRSVVVNDYGHLPVNTLVRLSGAKKRTIELDLARQRNRIADLRIDAQDTGPDCGFADIPKGITDMSFGIP